MPCDLVKTLGLLTCVCGLLLGGNVCAAGFADDFGDGSADGWTIIAGRWSVINGEFVETSDSASYNLAIHDPVVADFQLTAQLRSTDDDDLGSVFRFQDSGNYYLATFNTERDRIELRKRAGGVLTTLAKASANPYTQGVPFKATIRSEQQRIKVLLNDQTMIDVTAAQVTSGKMGLYARSNKYAAFEYIDMVDLAAKAIGGHIIYVDAGNEGRAENGLTPATALGTSNEALRFVQLI